MNEKRLVDLKDWMKTFYSKDISIEKASSDASYRTYYRVEMNNETKIIMDAPPQFEPITSFLDISKRLENINIHVPEIFEVDHNSGFILMEDLGKINYLDKLNSDTVYCLYTDALDTIEKMQKDADITGLGIFDNSMLNEEMFLFKDWFLERHLGLALSESDRSYLDICFNDISKKITEIPVSFVHRDYHSRNLIVTNKNNPGVIDYQDAVVGPITYDVVSLLKDCYIDWDNSLIDEMLKTFHNRIKSAHSKIQYKDFKLWFDITGLQRHLKAIGIFSRLNYRDNKSSYLDDIPRSYMYIENIINKYDEFKGFKLIMSELNVINKI